LWGEFCDWGIELSKASKDSVSELGSIFKEALKLLHPFMPFITEYLYHRLSGTTLEDGNSIMVMNYPKASDIDDEIISSFELAIEAIVSIRRCKTLIDKGNQRISKAAIKLNSDADTTLLKPFVEKLAKVDEVSFVDEKLQNCVVDVSNSLESMISTDDIDMSAIVSKLEKQQAKLEKEVTKLNSMLGNEKFVANAPKEVIEQNQKALQEASDKLAKVEQELKNFGA
jgi:valyl-tRNA synthetase